MFHVVCLNNLTACISHLLQPWKILKRWFNRHIRQKELWHENINHKISIRSNIKSIRISWKSDYILIVYLYMAACIPINSVGRTLFNYYNLRVCSENCYWLFGNLHVHSGCHCWVLNFEIGKCMHTLAILVQLYVKTVGLPKQACLVSSYNFRSQHFSLQSTRLLTEVCSSQEQKRSSSCDVLVVAVVAVVPYVNASGTYRNTLAKHANITFREN